MRLKDWLNKEGLKEAKVAKDLGIRATSLSKICSGLRPPGRELAIAIEKYTKGEVTLYDLLWPHRDNDMRN